MTVNSSPPVPEDGVPADHVREVLSGDAREIAPLLLDAILTHNTPDGPVSVRITVPIPSAAPHGGTRRCSARRDTLTSTSPTGCTTAPTSSADQPDTRPP